MSYYLPQKKRISTAKKVVEAPNIAINLPADDSRVNAYIISDNSENALILDYWHYPIKPLELKNSMFMGLALTKEFHVRIPREDAPCNNLLENIYYEVSRNIVIFYSQDKIDLSDSASGR